MKYKVALHHDDEGYSASVPGLPGCWSQGDTEAEALALNLSSNRRAVRGLQPPIVFDFARQLECLTIQSRDAL
jgi:hypothetical protein